LIASGGRAAWQFWSDRAEAALASRDDFVIALQRQSGGEVDAFVAKLIYTELVANVIRHAPGPIHIVLDLQNEKLWLSVSDRGPPFEWRPTLPGVLAESGRGMFLISRYAQEVKIERGAIDGNVIRVLLTDLSTV
jgi:anti-sigma regulatory factor (Ser/Thr protein kinase)